ncbi:MAG: Rrf2 family transcriptional regulator [Ruminiclostridium sp.]|nr:Rrf2 family transcriptional regulator [Ruminiclostridium sp.]
MQLQRDTDYALRILYLIGSRDLYETDAGAGMTLKKICKQSRLPRVTANRICGHLENAGFLVKRHTPDDETLYAPGPDLSRKTLLDVFILIDRGVDLFAVFDKNGAIYKALNKGGWNAQARLEKTWAGVTLGDFWATLKEIYQQDGGYAAKPRQRL